MFGVLRDRSREVAVTSAASYPPICLRLGWEAAIEIVL